MKRIALVLLGLILCSSVFSYITETASFKDFLLWEEPACEYDKWISHIVEGIASANYNLYAPYDRQTNGFGNFRVASTTELTDWGLVIDAFLMGELDTAQTLIDLYDFPYQVVHFTDLDTGRTYYMLREIPSDMYYDDNGTADPYDDEVGGFRYGWGLYVYNPMSTRPLIVTVPHPTDDYPSSAIGYEGFTYWDAKFLFVAGAGREVVWTNVGSYTNAKSISDPTRYANHPFNVAYNKSCDLIRTEFSQRELSVQMHTYDWNRHVGAAHVQIAAGYGRPCPNLPIRDLSDLKLDVINQGSNLMIPANTYGVHDDVYLNDFYTVYYNTHAFTFEDGDVSYPVNNYVTLTGAENNRQQVYSVSGITDYDSFEPFFHIEMDELPYCYDETQNNFKWFYGWEESSQRWDFSALFNNFVSFYKRWIVDLDGILDPLFTMNDGLPPTDPSNLIVHNQSLNYITLRWLPSSAYDFHSYEILYATEPIGLDNYQIFSRDNNNYLASQAATQVNVTGLSNSNTYYFRIRAVDKNGNYSNLSNEVVTIPAPANVTAFNTYGMDNSILCTWTVSGQSNNQGFKIYRKLDDTDFELIDSYASNPELSNPNNSYTMQYWDNNVLNGVTYTYQICAVNGNDQEFIYNVPSSTSPRRIHSISVMNQSETLVNTLTFGNNPFASDAQDIYYDVSTGTPSGSNYVWNAFWQQYWGSGGTYLSREIKGFYDEEEEVKSWVMRVRSDQVGQSLKISASDTFERAEKLYLYDSGNGTWANLLEGDYVYTNSSADLRSMTLYWGNLQPKAIHSSQPNRIYQGGTNITFYWSTQYPFLVDHFDVSIINATDSLWLSGNLPAVTNSYNYSFPSQADMQACKFVIDLYAIDGVRTRYYSDYTFGIVPAMSFLYTTNEWNMFANPWDTSTFNVTDIFGQNSLGYVLDYEHQWMNYQPFSFGYGYFVQSPDPAFYSTLSPVLRDSTSFALTNGWNLIPNPHLCAYNIKDLRFWVNGTLFKFSEMMEQRLISKAIYVYREGRYVLTDQILPYESFWIKCYGSLFITSMINFVPYYDGPSIDQADPLWHLNVSCTQSGADTDGFTIGVTPHSTDTYDFRLDLPEPFGKPFNGLSMYLTRSAETDTTFTENKLDSEYQYPLSLTEDQTKIWNFELNIPSTEALTLNFEPVNLPENYTVWFHLGDYQYNLNHGLSLTLNPDSAGIHQGYMRVVNYPVANQDLIQPALSGLKIYPNPFNPTANIAFSLSKASHVTLDVYNIKGQKVNTIYAGLMQAGNQILQWNGQDASQRRVSSGIYFVRVKTPAQTHVIKTMLMK